MKRKYNYILLGIISLILLVAYLYEMKKANVKYNYMRKLSNKHLELYLLLYKWVRNYQQNITVADYLIEKGYKNVAIYGLSYVGLLLYYDLNNNGINVDYGMERRRMAGPYYPSGLKVLSPTEQYANVDIVIVTSIQEFDAIKKELESKLNCPIICIDEIIYRKE